MSEREDNETIVNSRIGGRRETDMDIVMHLSDNYYTCNGFLKEKNQLTFKRWYKESGFYKTEIKLKELNRFFNKRAIK